jgi:hypothetical protein
MKEKKREKRVVVKEERKARGDMLKIKRIGQPL